MPCVAGTGVMSGQGAWDMAVLGVILSRLRAYSQTVVERPYGLASPGHGYPPGISFKHASLPFLGGVAPPGMLDAVLADRSPTFPAQLEK